MGRIYPLPTDGTEHWPQGEAITGVRGHHLGRRILDTGLHVTWGNGEYWEQINEPTSPRGVVWHLNQVCWLAVKATIHAPPPGCYAAFFRIRQPIRRWPLLDFSAEWKAAAITGDRPSGNDIGFLNNDHNPLAGKPPLLRQPCEATSSWSHRRRFHEENPGGWLLFHVGNIMVRRASDTQLANAVPTEGAAYSGGDSGNATTVNGVRQGRHVAISVGGNNHWARNLEVDFAAIAPFRLSWEIERVLMIGHRKGGGQQECPDQQNMQEGQLDVSSPPSIAKIDRFSPLSCIREGVMLLVLEFSQPTLVRSELVETEEDGQGGPASDAQWKVF